MSARKKVKLNQGVSPVSPRPEHKQNDFNKLLDHLRQASMSVNDHVFRPLLQTHIADRHPILPVLQHQNEIYKSNADKKKKPIQCYLETVNHLYKKRDLDVLINPSMPVFVFEKWAPRQVAIFEQAMLRFGKQFEFIAELIGTKNAKDVYEFYLQWKSTSHFKAFKSYMASLNRANIEDMV